VGLLSGPAPLVLRTAGPDQTRSMARSLAPLCAPGDVVLLAGGLGAGKTTFAQGFGAGLGITEPITSPTFTLVRHYAVTGRAGGEGGPDRVRTLLHADVYRLDRVHEIVDLGLGQLVEDGGVALVEWGDVAEPVLGEGSLAVALSADRDDDDDHRLISVRATGTAWASRWAALRAGLSPWRVAA
jgi:tRNA threonylcarbamoyladenosine biosynthesis protein TsaE